MASDETLRAFIALEIGPDVREKIADLLERLRKGAQFSGCKPSWSRVEGIHLTLKFLGNIPAGQVEAIAAAMRPLGSGTAPITFSARGLGVFPHETRPRVLWVGIKRGMEEVVGLQKRLDEALAPLGFEPESREFHPHLTLARFKSGAGVRAFMDVVRSHARQFCGEHTADRLTLFRSQLHPEGSRYSVLAETPFTGAPAI